MKSISFSILIKFTLFLIGKVYLYSNTVKQTIAVPEGVYLIISEFSKKCLGSVGAKNTIGIKINQWQCHKGKNQQWEIRYNEDQHAIITNVGSKLVFDLDGSSQTMGEVSQQTRNFTNKYQEFSIQKLEVSQYQILATQSKLCLDLKSGSKNNGDLVVQNSCKKTPNQKWSFEKISNIEEREYDPPVGTYKIQTGVLNKCVAVYNNSLSNGGNIKQSICGNFKNQQWELRYTVDGFAVLKARHSNLTMNVDRDAKEQKGANVNQWEYQKQDNQQFTIARDKEGNYSIINIKSSMCINALESLVKVKKNNINQEECNGKPNQKFKFTKISNGDLQSATLQTKKPKILKSLNKTLNISQFNASLWRNSNITQTKINRPLIPANLTVPKINLDPSEGVYQLIAGHSSKCLEVKDGKITEDNQIFQNTCNKELKQQFQLKYVNETSIILISVLSKKVLAISGASTWNWATLVQQTYKNKKNQVFKMIKMPNNYFVLSNLNSEKCIDVSGRSIEDKAKVHQWTCHKETSQQWRFEPVIMQKSTLKPAEANKQPIVSKLSPSVLSPVVQSIKQNAPTHLPVSVPTSNQPSLSAPSPAPLPVVKLPERVVQTPTSLLPVALNKTVSVAQQSNVKTPVSSQPIQVFQNLPNEKKSLPIATNNDILRKQVSEPKKAVLNETKPAIPTKKLDPPAGIYQLIAGHSSKCLEVQDGKLTDDNPIFQNSCNQEIKQQFELSYIDDTSVKLTSILSKKVFTISSDSTWNSAKLVQQTDKKKKSQIFKMIKMPNNYIVLSNINSEKCIDVSGRSKEDKAKVHQWTCHKAESQQWKFEPIKNDKPVPQPQHTPPSENKVTTSKTIGKAISTNLKGLAAKVTGKAGEEKGNLIKNNTLGININLLYMLESVNSMKCIDVPKSSQVSGIPMQQDSCTGQPNQKFSLKFTIKNTQELFSFVNKNSGMAITAASNKKPGEKLVQTKLDGSDLQLFSLKKLKKDIYLIINKLSNLCVEVANDSRMDEAPIIQNLCNEKLESQQWKLMK